MALLECPDCRSPVSSDAASCPKCGRRLKYWTPGRIILALILIPLVFVIASNMPAFCSR